MPTMICSRCFKRKPTEAYPQTNVPMCRGCAYLLDQFAGFFEFYGYSIQVRLINKVTGELSDPENPPKTPPKPGQKGHKTPEPEEVTPTP